MNDQAIALEREIHDLLHQDNGVSAHFEYTHTNEGTTLQVVSFKREHGTSFIAFETCDPDSNRVALLQAAKQHFEHNLANKQCTWTVTWINAEGKSFVSYFHASTATEVVAKFGQESAAKRIFSLKKNPEA